MALLPLLTVSGGLGVNQASLILPSNKFYIRGEKMSCTNRSSSKKQIEITIDDYPITICFAPDENTEVAKLVKETLIDSYLKNNAISIASTRQTD